LSLLNKNFENYISFILENYQKHQNLEYYSTPSIKKIDLISSEYMFNELDRNILNVILIIAFDFILYTFKKYYKLTHNFNCIF
jgi:hypothetical protein